MRAIGFLFALPIFEMLAVILPLTSSQVVRTSVILVSSAVAGGFALFVAFLLSNAEVIFDDDEVRCLWQVW